MSILTGQCQLKNYHHLHNNTVYLTSTFHPEVRLVNNLHCNALFECMQVRKWLEKIHVKKDEPVRWQRPIGLTDDRHVELQAKIQEWRESHKVCLHLPTLLRAFVVNVALFTSCV